MKSIHDDLIGRLRYETRNPSPIARSRLSVALRDVERHLRKTQHDRQDVDGWIELLRQYEDSWKVMNGPQQTELAIPE